MDEKQVDKWLRRRFSQVGWALLIYSFIMEILASLTMIVGAVGQSLDALASGDFDMVMDADSIAGNAWGYILAIGVGLVILYSWKGSEYWKNEILVREKAMKPGVFGALVCLCVGAQMVNSLWVELLELIMNGFGKSLMPMLESVSGSSDTVSLFLYSALIAPIAEEILFRGYVLRSLRPFGKRFAILGSAFLFGIFHGNLLQTPFAFLVGLLLGYVAAEYSIYWAIALHGFNNLVLADLLARLLGLLPEWAANILDLSILGVFSLIAVVLLIVRRQEIREYRAAEPMDRRCLKCFFTNSGIATLTALMVLMMSLLLLI